MPPSASGLSGNISAFIRPVAATGFAEKLREASPGKDGMPAAELGMATSNSLCQLMWARAPRLLNCATT